MRPTLLCSHILQGGDDVIQMVQDKCSCLLGVAAVVVLGSRQLQQGLCVGERGHPFQHIKSRWCQMRAAACLERLQL